MRIKVTNIYIWLSKQTKSRYIILRGGAGSGKSHALAQHLILKAIRENDVDILVLRKTFPSLRISCMKLILDIINNMDIPHSFNKTESKITFPSGSTLLFASVDQPEKYKSSEFNYIWMEEATEYNYDIFMQLDLRLRRQNSLVNQMFFSFNPISRLNWIYTYFYEKDIKNCVAHHSNYLNNPFLEDEYIDKLLELTRIDKNYAKVYLHGEWGSLENIVFNNYDFVDCFPLTCDEVIYGMDFGFNNPSGIVLIGVKDNEYYIHELLYKSKLTNNDLMGYMESLGISKDSIIYGDSAEPARIEEIYKNGWVGMKPAVKDRNSVKDGIDFCKRHKLHITKESVNLIKELGGYCWKQDKDGNVLDEPVKFNDHLLDAMRYAIYTHFAQRSGVADFYLG